MLDNINIAFICISLLPTVDSVEKTFSKIVSFLSLRINSLFLCSAIFPHFVDDVIPVFQQHLSISQTFLVDAMFGRLLQTLTTNSHLKVVNNDIFISRFLA